MNSFFLLILACAVSMLVIPVAMRAAPGLGLIDAPDPRKVHKIPVPRVGGWGIALGTLAPLLLMFGLDPLLQSFVIGVVVLFLFGVWDDARELGHWPKFVGQGVAVFVVVVHGGLHVTRLPFLDDVVIPQLAGQAFTAFAMIGAINAINHSDGLDGLAGGESVLSLLAIAFLGYAAGSPLDTAIALATIGGTFGFLRYNTHPARVFMGDCGSQVLGFALAFLVIHLSQVANPAMSPMVPVLLLGLPIADILMVLYKRASGGMNWFKATRNHVHHRLLDLGFTHFESVVSIYLLQATLILAGVLLQYEADHVLAAIYLAVMLLLFGALSFAERRSLRRGGRAAGPASALWNSAKHSTRLRSLTLGFISMLVPLLMLLPAGWVSEVPRDVGVLSVLAGLMLLGGMLMYGEVAVRFSQPLIRAITYVGVACAVYVFTQYPGAGREQVLWSANVLVAALAVAIGIFVRFLGEQRFSTTPTDYLVALGLIVLAAMDRSRVIEDSMVRFVTYAVVLFYGCEVIIDNLPRWRHVLGLPTLAALALLGLRGLA